VVAVVIAGAVVAGVFLGRSDNNSPNSQTTGDSLPGIAKGSGPGTSQKIDVSAIAAKLDPAVVDITSIMPTLGDEAAGTGMILTSNGVVLTNNHVIAEATHITADINGAGRTYQVRVLGADEKQDVALVQLEGASGLPTVTIGNSADVQIGDSVVAIGNALDLGGPETVTQGIISALDRSISASDSGSSTVEHLSGLLQTDAPINPGNSGGPLVNADGQVIGMDTAAATGSSSQPATDIGFAIPINEAIGIAQQIEQGKGSSLITINSRGFIGVEVVTVAEAEQQSGGIFSQTLPTPGTSSGAYVAQVIEGTPAVSSGLQEGDVITGVNSQTVATPTALGNILGGYRPGDRVSITWVTPSGVKHSTMVTLASAPVD
jgi:S1-C subfamily serine protease